MAEESSHRRDDLRSDSSLDLRAATILALLAAVGSGLAALLATITPLSADIVRFAFVADAIFYSAPLALLLHRASLASPVRAACVVAAFAAAALLAPYAGSWLVGVIQQPPDVNQVEFIYGAAGGFAGAAIALLSLPLLGIVPRTSATLGRIGIAIVCLSLVGGLACAVLDVALTTSVVWVAPLWQLACAPLLAFVLGDANAGPVAPMR